MKNSGQTTAQMLLPLVILLGLALAFAYLMPKLTTVQILFLGGGIALFAVCMASTEAALYLLVFSMLLSPEFIVGGTESATPLGRGVTLRVDDFILLIIGLSWIAKMAIHKELGLFLKTPLNKAVGYYVTVCLISTLLGAVFSDVHLKTGFLFVLKYFEYVFIYFMVANHLRDRAQVRNYVWALLITAVIVSIIGILQIPGGGRVSAPFEGKIGEPNTFGGYLVFMICIACGLMLTATESLPRLLYGTMGLLFFIPLLYTQSRSSYLAFIPAMLVFVKLSEKRKVILLAFIVGMILLPFVVPRATKDRIAYTFSQPPGHGQLVVGGTRIDTSTTARLMSWRNVMRDWIRHPFIGFGVTGYAFVDAQYFRILIETGVLGLAAFFLMIARIFGQTTAVFRTAADPMERGLSMGFIAGFVGLLVHAIGANTFIIVRIMEPFWFVLAMVIMIPNLKGENGKLGTEG